MSERAAVRPNIDLHLHTYFSDGMESPEVVIQRGKRLGFSVMAITDHDGIDGVKRAMEEGKRHGIRVIPGVEFSTEYTMASPLIGENRYFMHMLGYGIDLQNKRLRESMAYMLNEREKRNDELIRAFAARGIQLTRSELQSYSPSGFIGKVSFVRAFVKRGLAHTTDEAFKSENLMKSPEAKQVLKKKIDTVEAVDIINEAGGMAFLAHPYQLSYIGKHSDQPEQFELKLSLVVKELTNNAMKGIEAYYPTHDSDMVSSILSMADSCGLLVSRGSDDHGECARPVKRMGPFNVEADAERLSWVKQL